MWWYGLFFLPVAVIVWLAYEYLEHHLIQYETTSVECRKLPENKALRICLISDLHNNQKNLKKMINRIRSFSPDVILLAGDMVNKHKKENRHAIAFFSSLVELEVPVYYSEGNHELSLAEHMPDEFKRYLEEIPAPIRFLKNETVTFLQESEIHVSGLSLPKEYYKKGSLYDKADLLPELSVPEHGIHILMAHNPEYASLYSKYHADLIVSGHLHGGLLRLPFLGGVVSPRLRLPNGCDAGYIQLSKETGMFVSRGLGSHTIPLRFFNRAEVNFLVLKGTNEIEME